ncbi:zinc finger protein 22-like isoform X5 [Eurosta solidaginis]|uniref:zinc finger protein 22-like isoform X5 n=1 Tax=Eurosta solidaginis TaxID=178769 RepID=UPI003530FFD5
MKGSSDNRAIFVVLHLKTHKLIYSNEKPHKCKFCERRFTYALNLRRHIRTHTGGKPYKCEYCECTFAVSGPVLSHLRTHLGKNIHRCELCPSTFPHFTELRTQLTTHKDEDPETRERNMTALKGEEAKLKQNLATKIQQPPKPNRKYTCNFCNKVPFPYWMVNIYI